MGLFDHHHDWETIRVNKIVQSPGGGCYGEVLTQQCQCGSLRTVTIEDGKAPVIRMAVKPGEEL